MPFSKKKYNILKEHKKDSSVSPLSGTYSKKTNPSSNSLISSSKELLNKNKVPKQVNTSKKLKKIL